ncbi:MFS family permease [Herbaspirillum seropedicae]|uniref:MFS transporter n=1 Tax=Herbaspirillum seropedicae TaxID=964 RepID=UPI003397A9E0
MSASPGRGRDALTRLIFLQFLVSMADWMLIVLLQMLMFELTQSAFQVMLLVLAELAPMLLLGPWAGAVTDRSGLRRILGGSCAARLALILLLALPATRSSAAPLLAVAALTAVCNRFFSPAASALLPCLVCSGRLPSANAYAIGARMAGMALGAMAGGLLAGVAGSGAAILAMGLLMLASGGLSLSLPERRDTPVAQVPARTWTAFVRDIAVPGRSGWLPIAASMLVMMALGSFEIQAIIYVKEVLHRPSADVGLLFGAYGAGVVAGLILSSWHRIAGRGDSVIRLGLLLMCAAIGGVSQVQGLGSAALLVSMAGLAEGMVMSLGLLRLYQTVDPSRLGRATALLDSASGAAFLLAVVVTGLLADTVAADRLIGGLALVLAILSVLLITSGLQGGDVGRAKENVLATKNHENQNDVID